MRIAFLNLCHTDPKIVERVANKLTADPDFDMYIHVDAKTDIIPFKEALAGNKQVYFLENRQKVYWGGYNAIIATFALIEAALNSDRDYDYLVALQNLDYPVKSNAYIKDFFSKNKGTEYIRGCKIARTKDKHFSDKYKIYNSRDKDFYLKKHSKFVKLAWDGINAIKSISTITFNGCHIENGEKLDLYYGTAQWAITGDCARYMLDFYRTHPKFNRRMMHIKFPDEEYPHTVVHNSKFKDKCFKHDEAEERWLVNWRNIHYFEFPDSGVVTFTEKDFDKIMALDELFIRKVRSGQSERLMDMIDEKTT